MTFISVYPEKAAKMTTRWVAIWHLPSGFIHQTLPLTVQHDQVPAAEAYAQANPPKWQS